LESLPLAKCQSKNIIKDKCFAGCSTVFYTHIPRISPLQSLRNITSLTAPILPRPTPKRERKKVSQSELTYANYYPATNWEIVKLTMLPSARQDLGDTAVTAAQSLMTDYYSLFSVS